MKPIVAIKRIYEEAEARDGYRVLVDRLWPRGVKKEAAGIDEWVKGLAPTTELRKWFGHSPALWSDFQHRYKAELEENELVAEFIKKHKGKALITLLYGAKDDQHTHAIVLQRYLEHLFRHNNA
jgi:uncharacterized protein YeaO (DUF488 family)